jgi:hypothetical protein
MNPIEFDQRVRPFLAPKAPTHKETSTPLLPNPRPCEHCDRVVDQQVIHTFLKWTLNQPHRYKKCANCHEIIEKKLLGNK